MNVDQIGQMKNVGDYSNVRVIWVIYLGSFSAMELIEA